MKIYLMNEIIDVEDTIEIVCPHCNRNEVISDYLTIFHLHRLGDAIGRCGHCEGKFRIWYDGNNIKTLRIGKRKC